MHQVNTITMNASKDTIFEAAANLAAWPDFLPHYRFIEYIERSPTRNVVRMAANRDFIPISWVSEQVIDRTNMEVRFKHLKAWTKGMEVIWKFQQLPHGVRVEIVHDMKFRIPILSPFAEPIIGGFFIEYVANETLRHMKFYVEEK
jgi:ribosome-associated toxin RatA of RatAB toxin-antitoxin module